MSSSSDDHQYKSRTNNRPGKVEEELRHDLAQRSSPHSMICHVCMAAVVLATPRRTCTLLMGKIASPQSLRPRKNECEPCREDCLLLQSAGWHSSTYMYTRPEHTCNIHTCGSTLRSAEGVHTDIHMPTSWLVRSEGLTPTCIIIRWQST